MTATDRLQEFLVRITVTTPALDPDELAQLRRAELTRGLELLREGTIAHIWRLPGTTDNVGVWRASSATALHAAIASLPMFPFLRAEVIALAEHPVTASEAEGRPDDRLTAEEDT